MKVINLFAGPSAGKTTNGMVLAGLLSMADYKCEYVSEFAKFASWAKHTSSLSDQIYMFGKQHNRLHVLKDHGLDFVVMDGPILNALAYCPPEYFIGFEPLVVEVFNSYDNKNYFLERNPNFKYKPEGRNEDEQGALRKDKELHEILRRNQVPFESVVVSDSKIAYALFESITGEKFKV